jgi:hypothetical protein
MPHVLLDQLLLSFFYSHRRGLHTDHSRHHGVSFVVRRFQIEVSFQYIFERDDIRACVRLPHQPNFVISGGLARYTVLPYGDFLFYRRRYRRLSLHLENNNVRKIGFLEFPFVQQLL